MKEIDGLKLERDILEKQAVELQEKYKEVTFKLKRINRRITLYNNCSRNL